MLPFPKHQDPQVAMGDAKAIYERFVLTPLKLKAPAGPTADPPPSRSAPASPPASEALALSPSNAGTRRLPFALASPEVERLRDRVESAKLCDSPARRKPAPQKKKRVARAVKMVNVSTGGEWMDTPTKALRPAKRSRKLRDRDVDTDKENSGDVSTALEPVRRSMAASFAEAAGSDGEEDQQLAATAASVARSALDRLSASRRRSRGSARKTTPPRVARRSRRLAVQSNTTSALEASAPSPTPSPAVDLLTPLCDALVATNTISGLFFALSLNAMRLAPQGQKTSATNDADVNPFRDIYQICVGIARCEQLTQQQTSLPVVQLAPRRRYGGAAQALEKLSTPKVKPKKSVRFRSFDFSCLNLQYVENESTAAMVDRLIHSYGTLMEYISSILTHPDSGVETSKPTPDASKSTIDMLRRFQAVMVDTTRLYEAEADAVEYRAAYTRIAESAYGNRDSATQHEIRVAGEYFARQFGRLVAAAPASDTTSVAAAPMPFLHSMFSSLVSSTVRFKLRMIFLCSAPPEDDKDEAGKAQGKTGKSVETSTNAPVDVIYAHQDVGAAVHRALQESLLYAALVRPLLELLDTSGKEDNFSAVAASLEKTPLEDVERVDQFILARRFLRFHVAESLDARSQSPYLTETWQALERVCAIAKRFNFEDEAHLFPLAAVDEFRDALTQEEETLALLDQAVQTYWEAQEGYGGGSAHDLQECAECRALITRAEAPVSIQCTQCGDRFHLKCLHLPESFGQFAAHYSCPACFLGRGRANH